MECDENVGKRKISAVRWCGVPRERRGGGEGGVLLSFPSALSKAAHPPPVRHNLVPHRQPEFANDAPFMNNMDEISYWVYTKRAPCLFNFDNVLKKQAIQAHCSTAPPASGQSPREEPPPPRKKKRKYKLDEESSSTEIQQNAYFETSHNQKRTAGNCKSDMTSNVSFNIKNSPRQTTKRVSLQRKSQKKSKLITSTPKNTILRRSSRKVQQNNNNCHLESTFEICNDSLMNGKDEIKKNRSSSKQELITGVEKVDPNDIKEKTVLNGFEDLSDVSGFTANYIRSTKMHSKTPRKLRNRNNRKLIDPKNMLQQKEEKMLVCVNKSNDPMPEEVLNCSTDSSQNVLNIVSLQSNDKSSKMNKSTSLLKFMDSKVDKPQVIQEQNIQAHSASRYPKRHKNITELGINTTPVRQSNRISKMNNSEDKKNTEQIVTRARSGRRVATKRDLAESEVLNNYSEQNSSALNVGNLSRRGRRDINPSTRCLRSRHDKTLHVSKDSSESDIKLQSPVKKSQNKSEKKDKTGFSICFPETDSDSEPLKQNKFFC